MGYYINELKDGKKLPNLGKASFLIENARAEKTTPSFKKNLVCVVNNGPFDAAAFCYCENEFAVFNHPDGRPKTWLIVPDAEELAK